MTRSTYSPRPRRPRHVARTALTVAVLALILLAMSVTSAPALAAASTVVTPAALGGWAPANVRENATVGISADAPRGTAPNDLGSLKFTTDTIVSGKDKADFQKIWGIVPGRTLGSLSALSYEFYRAGSSSGNQPFLAPALRLYYATPGGSTGLLIWEPVYNGYPASVPVDSWVPADIFGGNFWMRTFSPGFTVEQYGVTLAQWKAGASYTGSHILGPDTNIVGIEVGVGSGWGGKFLGYVDNVAISFGADSVSANFEPAPQCSLTCYVDGASGSDANGGTSLADAKKTIQAGVDAVAPGGVVKVYPAAYSETASGRTLFDGSGPYQFGLFIGQDKGGITIQGVRADGSPIGAYVDIQASVKTNATNNFGASGVFVEGDGVTISGLEIQENIPGDNKTLEIIGDSFTLKGSHINVPDGGALYVGDWRFDPSSSASHIKSYRVEGNLLDKGTQIALVNGAGLSGPVGSRVIEDNTFDLGGATWPAISFSGADSGVPWFVYQVGGATITGNTFENGAEQYIRARGTYPNSQFDWASYWSGNTFDKAVVFGASPPAGLGAYAYPNGYGTFNNVRRIATTIQSEIDHAQAGDTVLVKQGTYVEQVVVGKSLALLGESGAAATFIKAPSSIPVASSASSNIVTIGGAGVSAEISGFTVAGPGPSGCGSIARGIFVRDGANANIHDNRIRDIRDQPLSGCQNGVGIQVGSASLSTTGTATIHNNTVTGYQKNGVTISNVGSSATISGNTITGAGATSVIAQNGVQISGGATGTISGNTIRGHSYTPFSYVSTGVLLYGSDADTDGNTIDENQVGIYHIEGSGTHDGNIVSASSSGTGSPTFWGIVVDDPPATRRPQPYDVQPGARQPAAIQAQASSGVVVKVINNELTGDGTSAGIGLEGDAGYGAPNIAFTATNNTIKSWGTGVALTECAGSGCTGSTFTSLKVNLNSIAGNRAGLDNTSGTAADAEQNWWGSKFGPTNAGNPSGTGDTVSGSVDFEPWLCSGADTSSAVGFQPNPQTSPCVFAASLAFSTQPGGAVAGSPLGPQPAVTIKDQDGNTLTTYNGAVTLALGANPGGGTLAGTLTVNAVNGVASFTNLSINKAGVGYTLVASAASLQAISGPFSITAGPAAKLIFSAQPGSGIVNLPLSQQPAVTALDAYNNTVTGFSGAVTLAIGANPGGGALSGTATVNAVGGVATFSGLKISKAGVGYTLAASATGLTSAISAPFNIGPANAAAATKIYAVHDSGSRDSQFFTIDLSSQAKTVSALGPLQKGRDIEALDIDPATGLIYATAGDENSFGQKGYLFLVDGLTGALTPVGSSGQKEIEAISFRPTDGTLWGWGAGKGLITINKATGASTVIFKSTKDIEGLAWSNDGSKLYATSGKTLYVYDPVAQKLTSLASNLPGATEALDMRPDGLLALGVSDKTTLYAYNVTTKQVVTAQGISVKPYDDVEGVSWPVAR